MGDEEGGKVDLHYPWRVKVMWRNASENHAGSKTYPDIREGLGRGSWMGLASLTQAQLPQLLSLKSGLRGLLFPLSLNISTSSIFIHCSSGGWNPAFSSFSHTSFHL